MDTIPPKVYRRYTMYLIPAFCIAISYNKSIHNENYLWLGTLGALLPFFVHSKLNLIFSIISFGLSFYFPSVYFLAYGSAFGQAYCSKLIISSARFHLNTIAFKSEIMALAISQCIKISYVVKILILLLMIICLLFTESPCSENSDPIREIGWLFSKEEDGNKTIILNQNTSIEEFSSSKDSKYSVLLCKEYKAYLKAEKIRPGYSIGIFYFLFFISLRKLEFLIFSFVNIGIHDMIVFIIGIFIIFALNWEWLGVFCKFQCDENVYCRIGTGFIILKLCKLVIF